MALEPVLPSVVRVTRPLLGGVNENHTEADSPELVFMTGSPASRVAVVDGVVMVTGDVVYPVREYTSGAKKESPMLD